MTLLRFGLALLLLLPQEQEWQTALEHARTVNLARADQLPNFIVDEVIMRYTSRHVDPPQWQYLDTIESEVVFDGDESTRQQVRWNGPWNESSFPPGLHWEIPLGYGLQSLFGADCPVTIEFEGRELAQGRPALAYRFHSPADGCWASLSISTTRFFFFRGTKTVNPARSGRFLIDDPGGNIIRIVEETNEIPNGFGMDPFKQTFSWDYVKIGDASHVLSVAAEASGGFLDGDLFRFVVEYKNHRRFEASTNLTFPEEQAPQQNAADSPQPE